MITQSKFSHWLQDTVSETRNKRYRHRLLTEYPNTRDEILEMLTAYVQNAHDDARRRLRKLAPNSLDPLGLPSFDPAKGYPELFHMNTLKGYFGEVFAGLIAEYFSPFGEDGWKVPAFLFRYHSVEFQQLELLHQTGGKAKKRTGRTGDDCLAFRFDDQGQVIRHLYCEAKCTPIHRLSMVKKAHKTVSESFVLDLPQIIEVLQQKNDASFDQLIAAIQQLWIQGAKHKSERCDMVSYICGVDPKRDGRLTWLPTDQPREEYKAQRRLEAVEIHLPQVESLIRRVYGKIDDNEDSDSEEDEIEINEYAS